MGYPPGMNETPICASVERDLQMSVDELTASQGTAPVPDTEAAPPTAPESA